jgi:hypothetical protein
MVLRFLEFSVYSVVFPVWFPLFGVPPPGTGSPRKIECEGLFVVRWPVGFSMLLGSAIVIEIADAEKKATASMANRNRILAFFKDIYFAPPFTFGEKTPLFVCIYNKNVILSKQL